MPAPRWPKCAVDSCVLGTRSSVKKLPPHGGVAAVEDDHRVVVEDLAAHDGHVPGDHRRAAVAPAPRRARRDRAAFSAASAATAVRRRRSSGMLPLAVGSRCDQLRRGTLAASARTARSTGRLRPSVLSSMSTWILCCLLRRRPVRRLAPPVGLAELASRGRARGRPRCAAGCRPRCGSSARPAARSRRSTPRALHDVVTGACSSSATCASSAKARGVDDPAAGVDDRQLRRVRASRRRARAERPAAARWARGGGTDAAASSGTSAPSAVDQVLGDVEVDDARPAA